MQYTKLVDVSEQIVNVQIYLIKFVKSIDIDQIWKVEESIHRQQTQEPQLERLLWNV